MSVYGWSDMSQLKGFWLKAEVRLPNSNFCFFSKTMVLVSFWARILCLGTSINDSSFSYVWMGKITLDRHRFVFWAFLKSPTKSGPEDICISFFSVTVKWRQVTKTQRCLFCEPSGSNKIGNTIKSEILDSIDVCALAYVSTAKSILQKQVELPTIPDGSFKMTFDVPQHSN